jgi:zinc transport system substrate-binding protein
MLTRMLSFVLIAQTAFTLSCGATEEIDRSAQLTVAVSIDPQVYFAERIGGDLVTVFAVVPPGFSPATYEPSAGDLRRLSETDVYFTTGVPFEASWLPRLSGSIPDLNIVATHSGIELRPMNRTSSSGVLDEHPAHTFPDPHVWLSPELVLLQAAVIAATLSELDPDNEESYAAGLDSLNKDIVQLQMEVHEILDPVAGSSFIVFHPSWGYFADEFDLVQIPIEVDGHEPSPSHLAAVIDRIAAGNIRFIFTSPQFSSASAKTIAEQTGAMIIEIDPLSPDWLENMIHVAARLEEALADGH